MSYFATTVWRKVHVFLGVNRERKLFKTLSLQFVIAVTGREKWTLFTEGILGVWKLNCIVCSSMTEMYFSFVMFSTFSLLGPSTELTWLHIAIVIMGRRNCFWFQTEMGLSVVVLTPGTHTIDISLYYFTVTTHTNSLFHIDAEKSCLFWHQRQCLCFLPLPLCHLTRPSVNVNKSLIWVNFPQDHKS